MARPTRQIERTESQTTTICGHSREYRCNNNNRYSKTCWLKHSRHKSSCGKMTLCKRTKDIAYRWCIMLLAVTLCLSSAACNANEQIRPEAPTPQKDTLRSASGQSCQQQTVGRRMMLSAGGSGLQPADSVKKVFCFYDIQDDFRPQDLNPCLCTHVVYSYVAVRKNLSFIAGKKGDLRSLASLKRKNSNLKLLVSLRPDDYFSFEATTIAEHSAQMSNSSQPSAANEPSVVVGGGDDSAEDTVSPPRSSLSPPAIGAQAAGSGAPLQMNEMHQKFAKRIRDFIVRHSLDGINLDWPYFAQTMPATNASRDHLNLVLQAINENFQTSLAQSSPSSAYLRMQAPIVTLTASKDFYSLVDGYDFHQVNKWVDFVHLPAFDFDLSVDQYSIGHPARLHGISDVENLDTLVDLLLSSGLPREQLIAGLPSHGVQITSRPATASAATNLDEQLEAAANISIISHAEVCRIRDLVRTNCSASTNGGNQQVASSSCWTMSRARDLTAPFAYDSEHWVGFDDENSVKLKAKYVLLRQLAGVALFNVNHDDPAGECGFGPYPLLATINGVFDRAASSQVVASANTHQNQQQPGDPLNHSGSNQRTYYTRAPNQLLTATSLISQIFGKKYATGHYAQTTPTPALSGSGDLMASASDTHHSRDEAGSQQQQQQQSSLMSFVDIIEKYGAVHSLDANGHPAKGPSDGTAGGGDEQLPCTKIGYQRYPRDCSRFYRCVQTPPAAQSPAALTYITGTPGSTPSGLPAAGSSVTRLQYECPSGLVFDEPYQICNWPSWSAQCTGSGEVNSITNSRFVCPNYGYFQNQENCEYFYYCSDYQRDTNSQAYQFRCPFELGFDEEKLQCNWKWLVKGCNATAAATHATNDRTSSNQVAEMAAKYLRQQQPPAETSTPASQLLSEVSSTPAVEITTTSTAQPTTITTTIVDEATPATGRLDEQAAAAAAAEPSQRRSKRSVEKESRSIAWSSHLASIMASVDAIREHRLKKESAAVGKMRQPAKQSGASGETGSYAMPTSAPSVGGSSASFRVRRRQASVATSAPSSDGSYSGSLPYTRPPAPPSLFSFLPNNAFYMIADSLRSYSEAIQGEVNRYLRVAGDGMRRIFGVRGGGESPRANSKEKEKEKQQSASRSDDDGSMTTTSRNEKEASRLDDLLAELDSWITTSSSGEDVRRRKRTKRQVGSSMDGYSETGDLQALESGPTETWAAPAQAMVPPPPHHQQQQQHSNYLMAQQSMQQPYQHQQYHQQRPQQQQHRDSLGRPPGYPLNQLDELAKSAVLGPEPKLYSQPSALISNQLSGISQQEYDRLLKSSREAFNVQPHPNLGHNRSPPGPMYANNFYRPHQQQHYHPQHQQSQAYGHHQQQDPSGGMMMSGSGVNPHVLPAPTGFGSHEELIGRLLNQARMVKQPNDQQVMQHHQQLPYGMPAILMKQLATSGQQQKEQQQANEEPSGGKKRRATVAMKLANLAMPRFVTNKPTPEQLSQQQQQQQANQKATKAPASKGSGYMSFFPSLTNVVTAPARNIMTKAMDLISTLAPGGSKNQPSEQATGKLTMEMQHQQQHVASATTPLPMVTRLAALQPMQHTFKQLQPQAPMMHPAPVQALKVAESSANAYRAIPQVASHPLAPNPIASDAAAINKTLPMYLTEEEARSLSAQLDQLSKDQLEALADSLSAGDEQRPVGNEPLAMDQQPSQAMPTVGMLNSYHGQQQHQQAQPAASGDMTRQQPTRPVGEPQDYVQRLLKMLSKTSKNPEDVKLLEQLAGQLNNPLPAQAGAGGNPLVDIVQSDDLALLETLGLFPAVRNPAAQFNETIVGDKQVGAASNEANYYYGTNPNDTPATSEQSHLMHEELRVPPKAQMVSYGSEMTDASAELTVAPTTETAINYGGEDTETAATRTQPPVYTTTPLTQQQYTTTDVPTTQPTATETSTFSTGYPTQYKTTTQSSIQQQQLLSQQYFESQRPVKQTYHELLESNVTTAERIESTTEHRVRTATSVGSMIGVGAPIGLGMVPSINGSSMAESSSSQPEPNASVGGVKGGATRSVANMTSYNFATQPVQQYEEIVIKKKFQSFPKQQFGSSTGQTSFTLDDARGRQLAGSGNPMEQVVTRTQDEQQQQQQPIDDLNSNARSNKEAADSFRFDSKEQLVRSPLQRLQELYDQQQAQFAAVTSGSQIEGQSAGNDTQQQQVASTTTELLDQTTVTDATTPASGEEDKQKAAGGRGWKAKRRSKASAAASTKGPMEEFVEIQTSRAPRPERLTSDASGKKKPTTRVEKAFSNFMVELKRSRKASNGTSVASERLIQDSNLAAESSARSQRAQGTRQKGKSGERKRKSKRTSRNNRERSRKRAPVTTDEQIWTSNGQLEGAGSRRQPGSKKTAKQSAARQQVDQVEDKWTATSSRQQQQQQVPASQYVAATYVPVSHKFNAPSYPMLVERGEQVAIYGTKSGFMPMIGSKDPSYQLAPTTTPTTTTTYGYNFDSAKQQHQQLASNSLSGGSAIDPLSFSASFVSNKRQQVSAMSAIKLRDIDETATKRDESKDPASWKNFVRSLSDQISVVNLGNYSEPQPEGTKSVQVKLVILPASPNNQLLEPANWQQLSRYYPQLFPANLAKLSAEPIELGPTSLVRGDTGAAPTSIDEPLEEMRLNEFKRQFEPISRLVERKTFKALDEIVQRSRGRMFMIQRDDDHATSRTIIASIPDRSLRRQRGRHSAPAPHTNLHEQHSSSISRRHQVAASTQQSAFPEISTTPQPSASSQSASQLVTTTVRPATLEPSGVDPAADNFDNLAPKKAAAFSRAIQESIQGAIRQHYKVIKNQLRQSMSDDPPTTSTTTTTTTPSTTTTTSTSTIATLRESGWSTPPADALANMESGSATVTPPASNQLDPLDTASSSTEYSLAKPDGERAGNQSEASGYSSHSVYEVDGAESKSLYGLELSAQQMQEQGLSFNSTKITRGEGATTVLDPGHNKTLASTSANSTSVQPSRSRFISIGSHLISSPMKLPKVVDQAYVNHFYDHIGDYQLAKSVYLDELAVGGQQSAASDEQQAASTTVSGELLDNRKSVVDSTSSNLSEDSLVPESACTRAGLFQHPFACNKFYECFWDKQLNKFTLHMFECPIKLAFDDRIVGCAMPIESSLCVNY